MNDISNNIKKVMVIFLICFGCLISYLTYFEMYKAPEFATNPTNRRLAAQRNEVLRGTIYDRNQQPLTKSEKINVTTQKRTYTGGATFAHVLGYIDPVYGLTGLESKYDSELMAKETDLSTLFNFDSKKQGQVGHDLVTTIDANLQKKAFDLLADNIGAVVALNPQTGEILALVSKPSFDPNNLAANWKSISQDKNKPLLNRAVSGLYPPGSTFKTITALSALENISDIKNRSFEDNGKLVFNDKESLSNFEGETLGELSFKDAYIHSSNVVFGGIGLDLGNSNLKTTAEKFYFNKTVPSNGIIIDNSRFPKFNKNEIGNIAQSAIGQSSVLASPMEMALVAATIANDGVMMKPYLVKKIIDKDGKIINETTPEAVTTVTTKENANYIKDLMRGVVESGTGVAADVDGLKVCGKTGTAENSIGSEPHSWFIAFAPYDKPQIALAVIVENGGQGGGIAATIAGQLIRLELKK